MKVSAEGLGLALTTALTPEQAASAAARPPQFKDLEAPAGEVKLVLTAGDSVNDGFIRVTKPAADGKTDDEVLYGRRGMLKAVAKNWDDLGAAFTKAKDSAVERVKDVDFDEVNIDKITINKEASQTQATGEIAFKELRLPSVNQQLKEYLGTQDNQLLKDVQLKFGAKEGLVYLENIDGKDAFTATAVTGAGGLDDTYDVRAKRFRAVIDTERLGEDVKLGLQADINSKTGASGAQVAVKEVEIRNGRPVFVDVDAVSWRKDVTLTGEHQDAIVHLMAKSSNDRNPEGKLVLTGEAEGLLYNKEGKLIATGKLDVAANVLDYLSKPGTGVKTITGNANAKFVWKDIKLDSALVNADTQAAEQLRSLLVGKTIVEQDQATNTALIKQVVNGKLEVVSTLQGDLAAKSLAYTPQGRTGPATLVLDNELNLKQYTGYLDDPSTNPVLSKELSAKGHTVVTFNQEETKGPDGKVATKLVPTVHADIPDWAFTSPGFRISSATLSGQTPLGVDYDFKTGDISVANLQANMYCLDDTQKEALRQALSTGKDPSAVDALVTRIESPVLRASWKNAQNAWKELGAAVAEDAGKEGELRGRVESLQKEYNQLIKDEHFTDASKTHDKLRSAQDDLRKLTERSRIKPRLSYEQVGKALQAFEGSVQLSSANDRLTVALLGELSPTPFVYVTKLGLPEGAQVVRLNDVSAAFAEQYRHHLTAGGSINTLDSFVAGLNAAGLVQERGGYRISVLPEWAYTSAGFTDSVALARALANDDPVRAYNLLQGKDFQDKAVQRLNDHPVFQDLQRLDPVAASVLKRSVLSQAREPASTVDLMQGYLAPIPSGARVVWQPNLRSDAQADGQYVLVNANNKPLTFTSKDGKQRPIAVPASGNDQYTARNLLSKRARELGISVPLRAPTTQGTWREYFRDKLRTGELKMSTYERELYGLD